MDTGLRRRVSPILSRLLTSPRTRDARRWLAERARQRRGEPHRIRYFHQVDDPYSQLAAQVLRPLAQRYDVEIVPLLAGPPSDAAAPERERLAVYARRDAADIAPGYGLVFPDKAPAPNPQLTARAASILASALASGGFASAASRVGAALWSTDAEALDALAREFGSASTSELAAQTERGTVERARLGHYLGAMFHYGGEWYWGVDRLWHLERRLQGLGALRAGASADPIARRPIAAARSNIGSSDGLALEFYPSLRSPYTAIAFERVYEIVRRTGVKLVLRPVLPMVMRGLPVPRAKQMYITLDTRREADDAGIRFGSVADPVGRPVERAFSLFPWARERGRAAEYLHSFARAAFEEGIDTGRDAGLRLVVERAGLSWSEAQPHLDGNGWRAELEANREAMFALGLWGVPSFCLRGASGEALYSTWGQDRLFRVEQEIAKHQGV